MKIQLSSNWRKISVAVLAGMLSGSSATAQNAEPKPPMVTGGGAGGKAQTAEIKPPMAQDQVQVEIKPPAVVTMPQYEATYNNYVANALVNWVASSDPVDELFGATLTKVDDILRAQLKVPADRGLLVSALRGDGPSAQAGLKQYDVLLTLAGKPLASSEDLTKQLKAAGEAAVPLKILRQGRPMTLQVKPIYRVTLGGIKEEKKEYFIGITVEPLGEAIRAQLARLPAGAGMVITEVIKDSPAEKAKVQVHDIVVELAGKPIDTFETLAAQVQANQDKPVKLMVLRGGIPHLITLAGAVRPAEPTSQSSESAVRFLTVNSLRNANEALFSKYIASKTPNYQPDGNQANPVPPPVPTPAPADEVKQLRGRVVAAEKELQSLRKIEELQKEVKALREAIENLAKSNKEKK